MMLSVSQLAARMGISQGAIRWHCRQGALKGLAQKVGRDWVIPDDAANEFEAVYDVVGVPARGKHRERQSPS